MCTGWLVEEILVTCDGTVGMRPRRTHTTRTVLLPLSHHIKFKVALLVYKTHFLTFSPDFILSHHSHFNCIAILLYFNFVNSCFLYPAVLTVLLGQSGSHTPGTKYFYYYYYYYLPVPSVSRIPRDLEKTDT